MSLEAPPLKKKKATKKPRRTAMKTPHPQEELNTFVRPTLKPAVEDVDCKRIADYMRGACVANLVPFLTVRSLYSARQR